MQSLVACLACRNHLRNRSYHLLPFKAKLDLNYIPVFWKEERKSYGTKEAKAELRKRKKFFLLKCRHILQKLKYNLIKCFLGEVKSPPCETRGLLSAFRPPCTSSAPGRDVVSFPVSVTGSSQGLAGFPSISPKPG